ncbi:MAG: ABC transporter substrate-binding protein [Bdellovibrionales bacterium]
MAPYTFVLAETGRPVSLDPLDADYANNLHASQMIYSTLLDVERDSTLTSRVLSSFSYNPNTAEIRLEVNKRARFNDGSPIRAQDIEMTVKRMMAKRPTFPVIQHVLGIKEWSGQVDMLSKPVDGLTSDSDVVRIKLSRHVENPLFRFALPLFGVVKRECVDLKTNKLSKGCATSGYYTLLNREGPVWTFAAEKKTNPERRKIPSEIHIKYLEGRIAASHLKEASEGTTVILMQEYHVDESEQYRDSTSGFSRIEQPNSRFSAFLLNPKHAIFERSECRRFFRDTLIGNISALFGSLQVERSLFSRILPGFLNAADLEAGAPPISMELISSCRSVFSHQKLRWMPSPGNNSKEFEHALRATTEQLEMDLVIMEGVSSKERFNSFISGNLDVLLGGSGFWAFDPVGDVQMLFTRGLHKPLSFVTSDLKLQELLNGLEFEQNPVRRLRSLNQYVYDQALLNVYSHSKRVYLTRGSGVSKTIPVAITPPAPWQMFDVDAR